MDFEKWLLQIGKSQRSAKSYSGAITGVISEWAKESGLLTESLTEIQDVRDFQRVSHSLAGLDIFVQRNTKGNGMYSAALKQYEAYLNDITNSELQDDIEQILEDKAISDTEKGTYVNARVGQGKYRKDLINHWGQCALTGFKDTRFLIASHIKPWKESENRERLDPYNGLLLLPNLDKAFDLGFVTFSDKGKIKISSHLEEFNRLGFSRDMELKLGLKHQVYMDFHREHVYEKNI